MRKVEDEEVFEEIRKLRSERGRLLQKIKILEQQQNSATTALEEVLHFNLHYKLCFNKTASKNIYKTTFVVFCRLKYSSTT